MIEEEREIYRLTAARHVDTEFDLYDFNELVGVNQRRMKMEDEAKSD